MIVARATFSMLRSLTIVFDPGFLEFRNSAIASSEINYPNHYLSRACS
jgi:hypothetical protein